MGQTDRQDMQMDGQTPDSCIDPALHTMQAVPIITDYAQTYFIKSLLPSSPVFGQLLLQLWVSQSWILTWTETSQIHADH